MATRSPKEVMEDRKIAVILDDLLQTCIDSLSDAKKITNGKTFKALDSATQNKFNKCQDTLLTTSEDTEKERDNCLDGKSRDLTKMKSCLLKQLDALDNLEEFNGRMQVLENKAVEATLAAFLAIIVIVRGANGDLLVLQKRFLALSKKLEKAIRATRDAKIKGMLGAGLAAIGICLVPFGAGVALIGGITLVGIEVALGAALKGNEETTLKKSWSVASGVGSVADGLEKMPKSYGPVMILATGAVDLREAFLNQRELDAFQKEVKAVSAEMKKKLPKAAKQLRELEKMAKKTRADVTSAIAAVRSFKPKKGIHHRLPGLLK